jgi:hypothetical protein
MYLLWGCLVHHHVMTEKRNEMTTVLPGRFTDPKMTLATDPRTDPRVVEAFIAYGSGGDMSAMPLVGALPLLSRERRQCPLLPPPHGSLIHRSRLARGARRVCVADPRDGRAAAATAQDHHLAQRAGHPQGRGLLHCSEGHSPRHRGQPPDGSARDQERNARRHRIVCEVTLMMTFDTGAAAKVFNV